ncbi:GDSL-type esterase/lipase family protein [Gilvimarinus sp. SDUM040013]|uniref:GDSL-type esterase/lipase family protein n=1 Tax=Gilvimarinus gilvus TaxID=3058038 RepID=A0ABU4RYT8_9GAMM|nr:GDSL-type esterase/lipase family protein [Gilvimarinus sp. SDUM040013]MDO3387876.1 GDSL-type esterase/lipase family protein [Gilvimarinus sp. SDUM040013]MDX6848753.1 GDSL-type esterase/lipase family protein [Gilvimarinus sp. SDUM040013]
MNSMPIRALLAGWFALACVNTFAEQTFAPDADHFSYRGRIDFSAPHKPELSWPSSRIDFRFHGTSVAVTLDDDTGNNFYGAFINGNWEDPVVLDLDSGAKRYVIADGLEQREHRVTLVKRTEGEEGATRFLGVALNDGAELLPAPPLPSRRIEIFGDSITSGMGNMAELRAGDGNLAEKNAFMSYGAIAARELDADYRSISQSGIGIMISWFGFTMPDFYDQLNAVGDNDSRWDFSRWTPDVVVINLLQNDSWLVEDRLDPVPTAQQRVQAYYDFLASVHKEYPKAFIIAALGSMDATKEGSPWPGYIAAAVAQYQKAHSEARLATLVFPFTGYGQHPRVVHHRANAMLLTDLIRLEMGW